MWATPEASKRRFSEMSSAGSSSERSYALFAGSRATKYVTTAAPETMSSSELIRNASRLRRMLGEPAASLIASLPHVAESAHRPDPHARGLELGSQPRHV